MESSAVPYTKHQIFMFLVSHTFKHDNLWFESETSSNVIYNPTATIAKCMIIFIGNLWLKM